MSIFDPIRYLKSCSLKVSVVWVSIIFFCLWLEKQSCKISNEPPKWRRAKRSSKTFPYNQTKGAVEGMKTVLEKLSDFAVSIYLNTTWNRPALLHVLLRAVPHAVAEVHGKTWNQRHAVMASRLGSIAFSEAVLHPTLGENNEGTNRGPSRRRTGSRWTS